MCFNTKIEATPMCFQLISFFCCGGDYFQYQLWGNKQYLQYSVREQAIPLVFSFFSIPTLNRSWRAICCCCLMVSNTNYDEKRWGCSCFACLALSTLRERGNAFLAFHVFRMDCGHAGGIGAMSGASPPQMHKKQETHNLFPQSCCWET